MPGTAVSQERGPDGGAARVLSANLSSDTVAFGDPFELIVDLETAPGVTLHIPNEFPETDSVAGAGAVVWEARAQPGGGARVLLRYPLVPFRTGIVTVPSLPLYPGAARGTEAGGAPGADAGSGEPPVVPFSTGARRAEIATRYAALPIPGRNVWVTALAGGDESLGMVPRPADDVVGRSWSAPVLVSGIAFASLLLALGIVSGRDLATVRAARSAGPGTATSTLEAARRAALTELDALLATSLDDDPTAVARVFAAGSDAVRRYVECFEDGWSAADTSTELMRRLAVHGRDGPATDPLAAHMARAEIVKFGRLRPGPYDARSYLAELRTWVAGS